MAKINLNFDHVTGKIRPLHGVGNAPIMGASNRMFHYLGEAGIPYSRLHDTGGAFGGHVFVDIENIFRNFDADVNDPASYDFAFTDWLLKELNAQGVEPFYRLGATIENYHYLNAYHIYPPKDPHKWAEICSHIIAHYNEGWANGFHFGIKYWEIWNEPDNEPEIKDNPMWKGTMEQFFELYEVTANLLKSRYPDLKIGGYASCGFYAIDKEGRGVVKEANVSPRMQYFIDFAEAFFEYITSEEHKSPIDFFSWHSYADMERNVVFAKYARSLLDRYGLTETESILNEWNPGIKNRGLLKDAALISGMMLTMHERSDVSVMTYYDGQVHGSYQGMFDPVKYVPFKAYYVFPAFNELYKLGNAVEISTSKSTVPALAAKGEGGIGIMISNTNSKPEVCELSGLPVDKITVKLICAKRNLKVAEEIEVVDGKATVRLGAYNVALIQ